MVLTDKVKNLFKRAKSTMGAPIRKVQLTDDQMCDLLTNSIGDFQTEMQKFIITSNWINIQGTNVSKFINNPDQLSYALTTRTMDWSRDFSYWFSREVGLQQRGNYELKKDFFKIEEGKQNYLIPAGREINRVLYITPSTTKAALYGTYGSFDGGFANGFGQFADIPNHPMGMLGMYVGSVYDVALQAADLKYKNSLIRGDLAYEVTAGPNGTHIIHLLSVPGGRDSMGGVSADDAWGWRALRNCYCWYTYYETDGTSSDNLNCAIENKDDVLVSPDQVPMDEMQYDLMNNMSQEIVRKIFIANCMITLGMVRGYASGVVKIPDAEMNLDYSMLLDTGKADKEKAIDDLKEWLQSLYPWTQMENQANMQDQLMKVLQAKPMPFNFIIR